MVGGEHFSRKEILNISFIACVDMHTSAHTQNHLERPLKLNSTKSLHICAVSPTEEAGLITVSAILYILLHLQTFSAEEFFLTS